MTGKVAITKVLQRAEDSESSVDAKVANITLEPPEETGGIIPLFITG